ncbi:DUF2865 domain-containing protein [Mesorhizobium sp. BAC0120]|uniref:DUF2865 domain-containing protein n=1 Tax=Mesorhizobium sp. BAC0120 TaxID=3090670 RepID=UPI00298CDBD1|nr:DUF2865 domain-containing protein [Mesorhizobium sp. BAC0120]MDW6026445.1 DUF2865 domain-containing protein [Mesorhizobium sp. BAC0120]
MRRFVGSGALSAAAIGAVLLSFAVAGPSFAVPRICRQLEAELSSAGRVDSGTMFRKYDRAVNAQRQQLATAESRAERAGCGFGLLSPQICGPLNEQIARMEANLAALERKREQLALDAAPQRSRARILAALDANGCRDEAVAGRNPAGEEPDRLRESDADLFNRLFGSNAHEGVSSKDLGAPMNVTRILNPNGETTVLGGPEGQFSTMCVRTCDGYYFPVSPNSSAADFERDQRNCAATCPGAEVQLYYRPTQSEETDTMISAASGEPYSSLPTAYVYRDISKPRVAACGCNSVAANPNFSVIGGGSANSKAPAEPVIPAPAARADPEPDPETLANARSKPDMDASEPDLEPKPSAAPIPPPGDRKVRVVGPVFLPDQGENIDLKHPK